MLAKGFLPQHTSASKYISTIRTARIAASVSAVASPQSSTDPYPL